MSGYGVINIGFDMAAKEAAVRQYVAEHGIEHVIIFYPGENWRTLEIDDAEQVTFAETIMYRTFYPLLQRIDDSYLLVIDECMRVKKRNALNYNCINYYGNQTKHKIVFEQFPFIDELEDFMILLDFIDKGRYSFSHFNKSYFDEVCIHAVNREYSIYRIDCPLPSNAKDHYFAEKKRIFENLGDKDPNTIPDCLELFVSKYKGVCDTGIMHVAYKKMPKAKNVVRILAKGILQGIDEVVFIDLPFKQKIFNDFIARNGLRRNGFIHTGLPVDTYLFNRYSQWCDDVNEFCAQASICTR